MIKFVFHKVLIKLISASTSSNRQDYLKAILSRLVEVYPGWFPEPWIVRKQLTTIDNIEKKWMIFFSSIQPNESATIALTNFTH